MFILLDHVHDLHPRQSQLRRERQQSWQLTFYSPRVMMVERTLRKTVPAVHL